MPIYDFTAAAAQLAVEEMRGYGLLMIGDGVTCMSAGSEIKRAFLQLRRYSWFARIS